MIRLAARVLLRIGLAMLAMSLLVRLADLSAADLVGDDLAIFASLGVILTASLTLRFGPH